MIPRSALSRRTLTLTRKFLSLSSQLPRAALVTPHLRPYSSTIPPPSEYEPTPVAKPRKSPSPRKPKSAPSSRSWSTHLPELPPTSKWEKTFDGQKGGEDGTIRAWLSNVDAQFECLEKFGLDVDDGIPKTVIEIYPGELPQITTSENVVLTDECLQERAI